MECPAGFPMLFVVIALPWAVADVASMEPLNGYSLPSSWEVGSAHAVCIGDAVTGT